MLPLRVCINMTSHPATSIIVYPPRSLCSPVLSSVISHHRKPNLRLFNEGQFLSVPISQVLQMISHVGYLSSVTFVLQHHFL